MCTKQPAQLLERAGFQVRIADDNHICCGSAGTYNILQNEMAEKLGEQKARQLEKVTQDFIASANLGCITQLQQYSSASIVHVIELLDWASGGPRPGLSATTNKP